MKENTKLKLNTNIYNTFDIHNSEDKNIINKIKNRQLNIINKNKYYSKKKKQYIFVYYTIGFITTILSFIVTILTGFQKFDNNNNYNSVEMINIEFALFIISLMISGFTLLLNFFKIETYINNLNNICTAYKKLIIEIEIFIINIDKNKINTDDLYEFEILILNKENMINLDNIYIICDIFCICCK